MVCRAANSVYFGNRVASQKTFWSQKLKKKGGKGRKRGKKRRKEEKRKKRREGVRKKNVEEVGKE